MSEEKRLMIENDLCMNKSKAQVIKLYLDLMEQYNKEIKEYQLELEKADSITQSCIFQGKQESEISFRNCLNKMTKYKSVLDKIKEYCKSKIEEQKNMTDFSKYYLENYDKAINIQHLSHSGVMLETIKSTTIKRYEDILELLEEVNE